MCLTATRFSTKCARSVKGLQRNQMSSTDTAVGGARLAIGFFERYLTVWVALCIVGGILLGQVLPQLFQAVGRMEVAQVNLPVGVLIWVMIIPMLVKIDFSAMTQVKSQWHCLAGFLSAMCSRRFFPPINSIVTSPGSSC